MSGARPAGVPANAGGGRVPRVLVVGGAGVFGSRLVDAVLAGTAWEVVVAGRDAGRTEAFLASRRTAVTAPRLHALVLDAAWPEASVLAATGALAVVDAAGPFQGARYALAEAAIAAGLHYLDLADARDFVAGFAPALDAPARARGVVALTGASSTPALSHAALDELTRGWSVVEDVLVCISPGNRAPRGLSVVRAILSYAGRPLPVFLDGAWTSAPGWGLTRRLAMPGLGRRWASLCDTPDLDLIPARLGVRRSAVFLAGLELPVLHLGLALLALPVRLGLLRSLVPLARVVRAAAVPFGRLGTDRGGMVVRAGGRDASGAAVRAAWHLVAEGGDGPRVPVLPALAALRALAEGRLHEPGARPCVGVLTLAEIEAEMAPYRLRTGRA